MGETGRIAEQRGGGNRQRADAFHFAPGRSHYAFAAIAALGLFAIAAPVFDLADAQAKGQAVWLTPAGAFLLLFALRLYWLKWRRPVLLVIGPEGLHLPTALVQPVAWRDIWRLSWTRLKISMWQQLIILKVELSPGLRPRYKRSLMTLPAIDGWIARKFGLRIPLQNLDADETTILASIERFRPVQRVTA